MLNSFRLAPLIASNSFASLNFAARQFVKPEIMKLAASARERQQTNSGYKRPRAHPDSMCDVPSTTHLGAKHPKQGLVSLLPCVLTPRGRALHDWIAGAVTSQKCGASMWAQRRNRPQRFIPLLFSKVPLTIRPERVYSSGCTDGIEVHLLHARLQ